MTQVYYTIEGERLHQDEILAKFQPSQHARVRKRLSRGVRTWEGLREPPHMALARARARVNRVPGVLK